MSVSLRLLKKLLLLAAFFLVDLFEMSETGCYGTEFLPEGGRSIAQTATGCIACLNLRGREIIAI